MVKPRQLGDTCEALRMASLCYICNGVPPANGKICACGGSGRSRDALAFVLTLLAAAEAREADLITRLEDIRGFMLLRGG
jgi:hypothetical protein